MRKSINLKVYSLRQLLVAILVIKALLIHKVKETNQIPNLDQLKAIKVQIQNIVFLDMYPLVLIELRIVPTQIIV